MSINQYPKPGTRVLKFRGDTQRFSLKIEADVRGSAWVRANLGHAATQRREIIDDVHHQVPPPGHDWYDIPMQRLDDRRFEAVLPLTEVGHFEAKCFFLKEGAGDPLWAPGDNTTINVGPAETSCANIIYNAFVRQFGSNRDGSFRDPAHRAHIDPLDEAGYTVIPPSGKFRDLIQQLDFIIGTIGCRFIQLLPVHPTPTTYARMGRFGSPYAALNFKSVDPALAEFDPKATPTEQFIELVDAVHARRAGVIMDIAINHTGWAANLHNLHPEWLMRDPEGRIEVPGAWGVTWADLTRLDYSNHRLWRYMADVFLTWCRRGVDGFRCDAGYMIPVPAWRYIVARVRQQFPDTVFLLEGLGGPMAVTRKLLDFANLDWAYSELFQNYNRGQIEHYLPEPNQISSASGIMIHFAETHDNERLAARSETWSRLRTALCALASQRGGFGFANGMEWLATEKINVHGAPSLNWGAEPNQVEFIRRLAIILKTHPTFLDRAQVEMVQEGQGNFIVLRRHHESSGKKLLVAANLDPEQPVAAAWRPDKTGHMGADLVDLITGATVAIDRDSLTLKPGQILCLSQDPQDLYNIESFTDGPGQVFRPIHHRNLRAKTLEIYCHYNGIGHMGAFDADLEARSLEEDPVAFCRGMNPESSEPRVVPWQWPRDIHREVMIPPGYFLLVTADEPFRARLTAGEQNLAQEDALLAADGTYFALFTPLKEPRNHRALILKLAVFEPRGARHADGPLLQLSGRDQDLKTVYSHRRLLRDGRLLLSTNGRGAMLRAAVQWGKLNSRYDALLAANLNPNHPEDRWIMFTRCRAWVVYQGYSRPLDIDCLDAFGFEYGTGWWRFQVPTGQGQHIDLTLALGMVPGRNAMAMVFHRHTCGSKPDRLPNPETVRLILRPDIEDRNFHDPTKAFSGPEHAWPAAVTPGENGFSFAPHADRCLEMSLDSGTFTPEPEWTYMVHRPLEAQRGLDPDSDLFSPGYFAVQLTGGDTRSLTATASEVEGIPRPFIENLTRLASAARQPNRRQRPLEEVMLDALDQFVVARGDYKSVVAGYPWFLDWGRDSLIVVRGLVAAGKTDAAKAVLHQFGRFEQQGTLPNMIRGEDAGNRNTSDAPLWFFTACADLAAKGQTDFLDEPCGDRSLREVLLSMGHALSGALPNGVCLDPQSGLLFSPTHYTWMDTNHPAGTPRQGYPIEIQALWSAALEFLSRIDDTETATRWRDLAAQVKDSIMQLYFNGAQGYLSDCLHASAGTPAIQAEPDDALRSNQLLALTLDAVPDRHAAVQILNACQELLIPGAIRSLSNRPVARPLAVMHHQQLLNDPHHPYQGRYVGDEDTRRKPAYHNGTAWTWPFPSFSEAWFKVYGETAKPAARAWLLSSIRLAGGGCLGHLPEILDGDYPHLSRGCDAQAWGASEWLRVWHLLKNGFAIR
jgi:starch synthase (maltosyl-transferring)